MDILWPKRGYFGLLGNANVFKLSYYILSKDNFIGLQERTWEDSSGTMASVENTILVNTMVFIVWDKVFW